MLFAVVISAVSFYWFNIFGFKTHPEMLGVVVSPLFTIFTLAWVEEYKAKWNSKYEAFKVLYANRFDFWNNEEAIKYLNLIDVLFLDDKNIREKSKELIDVFTTKELNPDKLTIKNIELLQAIASSLGLNKDLSLSDIHSMYKPVGLYQGKDKEFIDYCKAGKQFFSEYKP